MGLMGAVPDGDSPLAPGKVPLTQRNRFVTWETCRGRGRRPRGCSVQACGSQAASVWARTRIPGLCRLSGCLYEVTISAEPVAG